MCVWCVRWCARLLSALEGAVPGGLAALGEDEQQHWGRTLAATYGPLLVDHQQQAQVGASLDYLNTCPSHESSPHVCDICVACSGVRM